MFQSKLDYQSIRSYEQIFGLLKNCIKFHDYKKKLKL